MYQRTPILYRIADSFFRHRWLFLITVLVVAATTSVIVLKRSEKFIATAALQIIPDKVASDLGFAAGDPWNSPAQRNASAFNEYMQFPDFRKEALSTVKLTHAIDPNIEDNDPRLRMLIGGMSAYAQTSRLMGISLVWDDPDEAKLLAGAFQNQFKGAMSKEQAAGSIVTETFLNHEIESYRHKMLDAEKLLIDYKKENAGELPEAQSNDIAQYSSLKAQLESMQITAGDAALRRGALLQQMARIKPTMLEQTTGISPFENQINQLKVRKEALLASGKLPSHPMVSALTDQIAAMVKAQSAKKKVGASETNNIVASKIQDNPQYQNLQSELTNAEISQQTQNRQMAVLTDQIAKYKMRVENAPLWAQKLIEKQRTYGLYKAQYDKMLSAREEVRLRNKLQQASASSTYQDAISPYVQPMLGTTKKAVMLFGSLILGMIVGIVLVVLSEWADRSVRYEGDAEHLLGVPVLAMLPETAELRYLPAPHGSRRNGNRALPDPNAKAEAIAAPGGSSRDN